MAGECELGVTGLATMGANLARNAARNGFPVAVHNRTESRTRELLERHGDDGELVGTFSTGEFVAALARPRRILVMVKAGPAVDAVLEELAAHLEVGDLLIDGGNSYFEDTVRREQAMTARGLRFLGTGVSGGEEGALWGPSIMPGGSPEAYGLVEQLLTTIAAQVDGVPCCRLVGPGGAGHYVKMVHNGIEYADMQLIAEAYDLLGQGAGMGAATLAEVFEGWNAGDLDSFLIEITAKVLRQVDQATGRPLVDVILDGAVGPGAGRARDRDHRGGVRQGPVVPEGPAHGRGQGAGWAVGAAGGRPDRGVRGRRPRCPVRLQGGRLRPGVRADRGRRRGQRLGRRAGRPGHHLAGRLHHPGPVPGPHPRGL
jgi:6-phosphogluconate dehydrogenase